MTVQKPRLGHDNLLVSVPQLIASSEADSDFEVANLASWREGRYWKPDWTTTPPADSFVYLYPCTGQLIARNWLFEDWSLGGSAAPDGWELFDGGASTAAVARDATTARRKLANYAAKVTRSGDDCYLDQDLLAAAPYLGLEITVGAWVDADVAGAVDVALWDGFTETRSGTYHAGSGGPVWKEATATIDHRSSIISIRLVVRNSDGSGWFSGAAVVLGDTLAETPHSVSADYMAFHDHNLGTGEITVTLQKTADPADWSSPTDVATLSPSDDLAAWKSFTSDSSDAWRLKFSGSRVPVVAVAAVGAYTEWPEYIPAGSMAPWARRLESEVAAIRGGVPIGRKVVRAPISLDLEAEWVTEAQVTALDDFLDHAYGGGLPFFFSWDPGDHADEVFYAWLGEGADFDPRVDAGLLVQRIRCQLQGVRS